MHAAAIIFEVCMLMVAAGLRVIAALLGMELGICGERGMVGARWE